MPYDQYNTSTKGRIGEYFVAFILEREGIEASIVDRVGTDLFCRRPNGEMFSVEVKTAVKGILAHKTAKTPRMNYTIKTIRSDWYAFVELSSELVLFKPRSELENHANKSFYVSAKEFSKYERKMDRHTVKGKGKERGRGEICPLRNVT